MENVDSPIVYVVEPEVDGITYSIMA